MPKIKLVSNALLMHTVVNNGQGEKVLTFSVKADETDYVISDSGPIIKLFTSPIAGEGNIIRFNNMADFYTYCAANGNPGITRLKVYDDADVELDHSFVDTYSLKYAITHNNALSNMAYLLLFPKSMPIPDNLFPSIKPEHKEII